MTSIYLLPTPLGEVTELTKEVYRNIGLLYFDIHLVETEKKARENLRLLYPSKNLRSIERIEVNHQTNTSDLRQILTDIEGKRVVLMPDVGEPGIADPGSELIREAHRNNYNIIPLLFTSSITAALASSGLSGQNFTFNGYLPKDKDGRIRRIKQIEQTSSTNGYTQIFIETPYRNRYLWGDLMENLADSTDLSVAIGLFTSGSKIRTASVSDWKRMKWPEVHNRNAVFSLSSLRK